MFSNVYARHIEFKYIVCGMTDRNTGDIVTVLAFLAYKEWLLKSLEHKNRPINSPYNLYVEELKLRQKIYEMNNTTIFLDPIIEELGTGIF